MATASYPQVLQPHRTDDTMTKHRLRGACAAVAAALALLAAAGGWTALPAQAGIVATGLD